MAWHYYNVIDAWKNYLRGAKMIFGDNFLFIDE